MNAEDSAHAKGHAEIPTDGAITPREGWPENVELEGGQLPAQSTGIADGWEQALFCEDDWGGKKGSWCTYFRVHLFRLFQGFIGRVKILPHEKQLLIDKQHLGPRASQFAAWRCSLLACGTLFFAATVSLEIVFVVDPWNAGVEGSQHFILKHVSPRYRRYFDDLVLLHEIESIALLAASGFAVLFAFAAAWKWHIMRTSERFVQLSFACSFTPQFLLLLCMPFRHAVDFEGVQRHMCHDVMNGTQSVISWARNSSEGFMWPAMTGGLANELLSNYGLKLPHDFCNGEPETLGDELSTLLATSGFLLENGTCSRAEQNIQDMLIAEANSHGHTMPTTALSTSASVSDPVCRSACSNCTTSCLPHLTMIASLLHVYSDQALQQVNLGPASQCTHCFVQEAGASCTRNCSMVAMALSRQAVSGKAYRRSEMCIRPEDLESFMLLVELGTKTSYWRSLLGSLYAVMSLGRLLPLTFSLLFGAAKGASISKSAIPYSRVPDVIGTSAAVFTFPFIFQIAILVQNIAGNLWTLFGICFMLCAIFTKMNPQLMGADTFEEFAKDKQHRKLLASATLCLALILFAVAVLSNGTLDAMLRLMEQQGFELSEEDKKALGKQFSWYVVRMGFVLLGQSLVSAVFFADGVMDITHRFHHGEENDEISIKQARLRLTNDLHTLFHQKEENLSEHIDSQAVCPASDCVSDSLG